MITIQQKSIGYDKDDRTKFNSNNIASGVQMTFKNGYTISIQFGFGNYCENKFCGKSESKDCEIAVFDSEDNFVQIEGMTDDVVGYCSIDEVADYIYKVKNL